MLASLDKRGVHTVKTILGVEYDRCTSSTPPSIKAYNGLSIAGRDLEIKGGIEEATASDE